MPLDPGETLTASTPPGAHPPKPPVPIADVDLEAPSTGNLRGRRAADGTNWCLCCDTVIKPGALAVFCETHERERNTQLRRRKRTGQRSAEVPIGLIDTIVEKTDVLAAHLGRATAYYNASGRDISDDDWINALMLASKDLFVAVDRGLRTHSSYRSE